MASHLAKRLQQGEGKKVRLKNLHKLNHLWLFDLYWGVWCVYTYFFYIYRSSVIKQAGGGYNDLWAGARLMQGRSVTEKCLAYTLLLHSLYIGNNLYVEKYMVEEANDSTEKKTKAINR